MRIWNKKTLKDLLLPGAALLATVAVLVSLGWLTLALPALNFLYYCALGGGMLLAWRFHSSRVFLSLLVLCMAERAVGLQVVARAEILSLVAVLVSLNFVLIVVARERGFRLEMIAPVGLVLFIESVVVFVFGRAAEQVRPPAAHLRHSPAVLALPGYVLLIIGCAGLILLGRFLATRKPVDSAMFWSLCGFLLAIRPAGDARVSTLYWATAACILAASIIENSYLLAYHDELTTLPSRRAFNDALMRLQAPYCIAVVDIDHFKRFNDTYGHDVGDQVLQLVAGNLSRVTGGGRAYRCGGEEFTILFPGKSMPDVTSHLEDLRKAIEASTFHMRGQDRRKIPRGPDRRLQKDTERTRRGQAKLEPEISSRLLSVTASIGVATSSRKDSNPDSVLQAADKALYRAKANGRNRVETSVPFKRARVKSVGIA